MTSSASATSRRRPRRQPARARRGGAGGGGGPGPRRAPRPRGAGGGQGDNPLALVEAALEAGATVVSAALGDPAVLAPLAQAAGAPLVAMVSTAEEARRSAEAGADVIVAQGMEAGGHRTTFDV